MLQFLTSDTILDRSKLRAYAIAGVKKCSLALALESQIIVHRHSQGEQFAEHPVHGPGGALASAAVQGVTVGLDRRFAACAAGQK